MDESDCLACRNVSSEICTTMTKCQTSRGDGEDFTSVPTRTVQWTRHWTSFGYPSLFVFNDNKSAMRRVPRKVDDRVRSKHKCAVVACLTLCCAFPTFFCNALVYFKEMREAGLAVSVLRCGKLERKKTAKCSISERVDFFCVSHVVSWAMHEKFMGKCWMGQCLMTWSALEVRVVGRTSFALTASKARNNVILSIVVNLTTSHKTYTLLTYSLLTAWPAQRLVGVIKTTCWKFLIWRTTECRKVWKSEFWFRESCSEVIPLRTLLHKRSEGKCFCWIGWLQTFFQIIPCRVREMWSRDGRQFQVTRVPLHWLQMQYSA